MFLEFFDNRLATFFERHTREFARKFEAFAASAEVKAVADAIAPYFAPQQVAA